MPSRMNRYDENSYQNNMTRSNRNQELYDTLGNNKSYTTYADIRGTNEVVLDAARKDYRTREGYQKIKEYSDIVQTPKIKQELEDFTNFYKDKENKVYDINSVIEEAKRNRIKKDELEEKRKLKNTNYNILASLDQEKLEEYRKERNHVIRADQEELKELINTITTKTLKGEIDQETGVNLLSDLMATQAMDRIEGITEEKNVFEKVENKEMSQVLNKDDIELVKEKEIEEIQKEKELKDKNQSKNIFKDMDQSFYTRSMDLSDKDFELDCDGADSKKGRVPVVIKVLLIVVLVALIVLLGYIVLKDYIK